MSKTALLDINFYVRRSFHLFGDYDGHRIHFSCKRKLLSYISLFCHLNVMIKLHVLLLFLGRPSLRLYLCDFYLTDRVLFSSIFNFSYSTMTFGQVCISYTYLTLNDVEIDRLKWMQMFLISFQLFCNRYGLDALKASKLVNRLKKIEFIYAKSAIFNCFVCTSFMVRNVAHGWNELSILHWMLVTLPNAAIFFMSTYTLCQVYNQIYVLYFYTSSFIRFRLDTNHRNLIRKLQKLARNRKMAITRRSAFKINLTQSLQQFGQTYVDFRRSKYFFEYSLGKLEVKVLDQPFF